MREWAMIHPQKSSAHEWIFLFFLLLFVVFFFLLSTAFTFILRSSPADGADSLSWTTIQQHSTCNSDEHLIYYNNSNITFCLLLLCIKNDNEEDEKKKLKIMFMYERGQNQPNHLFFMFLLRSIHCSDRLGAWYWPIGFILSMNLRLLVLWQMYCGTVHFCAVEVHKFWLCVPIVYCIFTAKFKLKPFWTSVRI